MADIQEIRQKLGQISEIKSQLKTSINKKVVDPVDTDFTEYADAIRSIKSPFDGPNYFCMSPCTPNQEIPITIYNDGGATLNLQYRLETEKDWKNVNIAAEEEATWTIAIKEKIYFRGKNPDGISPRAGWGGYTHIIIGGGLITDATDYTKACDLSGDLMTLIDYENIPTTAPNNSFAYLFGEYNIGTLSSYYPKIRRAKDLVISAQTVGVSAYEEMFSFNPMLVSAPELPATTLATSCYAGMFIGCTNLTTAPELPATTLANGCYQSMFKDCITLEIAPDLKASALVSGCYYRMFDGCVKLKRIRKVYFDDWADTTSPAPTALWLNNAGSEQTGELRFYCPVELDLTTRDNNHVPDGWTIYYNVIDDDIINKEVNAHEVIVPSENKLIGTCTLTCKIPESIDYLTIESKSTTNPWFTVQIGESETPIIHPVVEYSFDKITWTTLYDCESSIDNQVISNRKMYIRGNNPNGFNKSKSGRTQYTYFEIIGEEIKLSGNLLTLLYGSDTNRNVPCAGCFSHLFYDNACITDVKELILPVSNIENVSSVYEYIFYNSNITSTPVINKLQGSNNFKRAFANCKFLTELTINTTSWNTSSTTDWMTNTAECGTAYIPENLSTGSRSASKIPSKWYVTKQ